MSKKTTKWETIFKDIDEKVGKVRDGISATKRMIGFGGDETNKSLADIAGMSLKGFKKAEEMEAIEKAKQKNQESVLNTLLETMGLSEALTNEQKKLVAAASPEKRDELLKAMVKQQKVNADFGPNLVDLTSELLKETEEQGKNNKRAEAKRIESEKDRARQANQNQMGIGERMNELLSKFKSLGAAAGGIGQKAAGVMKEGGEMMKNLFGEMFGTLGANALMSMSGLTKSFASIENFFGYGFDNSSIARS